MHRTLELSWSICLRIWWSLFWRSALFGLVVGTAFAFFGALIAKLAHGNPGKFGVFLGVISSIPTGLVALYRVLQIEFKGFKIVLMETGPLPEQDLRIQSRRRDDIEKGE